MTSLLRTSLAVPGLVLSWLTSLGLSLLDQPLDVSDQPLLASGHTLVCLYLPAAVVTLPCQIYLYTVASRHYRYIVYLSTRLGVDKVKPKA